MSVLVVGGQARKVGKTSVVCGIISATRELEWTAVKLTHHLSGAQAEPVEVETGGESGDCGRFLQAGAVCTQLLRVKPGETRQVRRVLYPLLAASVNVIIESVGVLEVLTPDVFLLVVDPANRDFKDSARQFAPRASALLAHPGELTWPGVTLPRCPVLRIEHGNYVTPEMVEFVRKALLSPKALD